ncbi:MAG: DUF4230 domain-containing protein [Lachnospiraceae bacterium]|nr:DUF4230 domain-containing protein [Lachnospiraceae bacterium]
MADNGNEKKGGVGRAFFNMLTVAIIAVVVIHTMNKAETIFAKGDEPTLSSTFISEKLERVSELTTAKLTYNGLVQYSDGKVPFITKKAFSMIYRAEVKAGVELSETDIAITDTTVTLTLPQVKVFSVDVDSNSIQFYDEKSALFNWTNKEDVVKAVKKAEEDVKKNADIEGLKEEAREQNESLIKGLLEGTLGGRELIIKHEEI